MMDCANYQAKRETPKRRKDGERRWKLPECSNCIRNLIRRSGSQENCGPLKEFSPTGIRTTRCAKVARRKGRSYEGPSVEQGRRKNETKNKFSRGTQKLRTLGRIQLMCQEGTNGTRNRDVKEQIRLGNQRTSRGIYRKSTGLEIAKRIARCTLGLQRTGPCGGVDLLQKGKKKLKV
jgi:hypothetical protein